MLTRVSIVLACLALGGGFFACTSDTSGGSSSNDDGGVGSDGATTIDGGVPGDGSTPGDACATSPCVDACQAAANAKSSVGCDFYATRMETNMTDACFAAYVVNTSSAPLHISAELPSGISLTVASFTRIPSGVGTGITYGTYDAVAGLPVGGAAILFLSGATNGGLPCPVAPAVPTGTMVAGTGVGHSFHITTDQPAAMFQMNPYGGGAANIPGASLLLPTTAWDTNYVAVTPAAYDGTIGTTPTLSFVAAQDGTQITIRPAVAITGGGTLAAGAASSPYTFMLNKGEQAQFSQQADLAGSVIQATKPFGFMSGHACANVPTGISFCDHLEQMLPPIKAIGHTYAGVMYRPRVTGDKPYWKVAGVVDGTTLTYSSTVAGAPLSLNAGQVVTFQTDTPFTVTSQDAAHPFLLFQEMTGEAALSTSGYGDPDFVLTVPVEQFGTHYDFFADPTFPENDLVVVRAKNAAASFDDVNLDCAGVLTGWQDVGAYQWARIDLSRHDFAAQGSCAAGRHSITSAGPFTVTVWGWGSPETTASTTGVSYGYPAGMSVAPINAVVVTP